MRLTGHRSARFEIAPAHRLSRGFTVVGLTVAMAIVFSLDRITSLPHVQHLYYLPIILAAIRFGTIGGTGTAAIAIALYHLANPHVLSWRYEEADIVQIAIFVAVGFVAAKLGRDARRFRHLALTDDLTGLHNLRSFELELETIVRHGRTTATPVSLLVIDIDRLKSLNDAHGHLVGAEAVRTVGRIIGRQMPPGAVACRYGGDEFVVGVSRCPARTAQRIATDLRRAVRRTTPRLGHMHFPKGTLSISIGVACRSFEATPHETTANDREDGEALFRAADGALYAAKNAGRDRVRVVGL